MANIDDVEWSSTGEGPLTTIFIADEEGNPVAILGEVPVELEPDIEEESSEVEIEWDPVNLVFRIREIYVGSRQDSEEQSGCDG